MPNPTDRRPLGGPEPLEPRDLPAAPYQSLPVLPFADPAVLAHAREVAARGREVGRRTDVFLKVGDSNTLDPNYLRPLGLPAYDPIASGLVTLRPDLIDTLFAFRTPVDATGDNSFTRSGRVLYGGYLPILTPHIPEDVAAANPGLALVMVGTNDLTAYGDPAVFRALLTNFVQLMTGLGVLPVLSTVPPNHHAGGVYQPLVVVFNQVIADVAAEQRVPLWNAWRELVTLPDQGVLEDIYAVHLTTSPRGGGSFVGIDLAFAQNLRNLRALEILNWYRQKVLAPPDPVPPLPAWAPLASGQPVTAVGAGEGYRPVVDVFDAAGGLVNRFLAYDPAFFGGVRVAVGDVDGDSVPDIVTGPGYGGGPVIRGYSGADGHQLFEFLAFEPEFRGGVTVAVGDVDGDGRDEIVVGAGEGGGPRVRVFRAADLSVVSDFLAFEPSFRGGVTVAAGDFGVAVGAGVGGAPVARVFDPVTGLERVTIAAYDLGFRGGVSVAAGDFDGDGREELVTGAGPGGGPVARVFDPLTGQPGPSFFAGDPANVDGVRVAAVRGGRLIAASGGGLPTVRLYDPAGNQVGGADDAAPLGASFAG